MVSTGAGGGGPSPRAALAMALLMLLALALPLVGAATNEQTQQARITPSDATAWDRFGEAVAADGGTLVVGSPNDDDKGSSSGSAYVFVGGGTTWSQQAKLTASDGATGTRFGWSVAISEDTVAVGAPFDAQVATNAGAIYLFTRSGNTWSQQAKVVAADGGRDQYLGRSVAIDGDTLIASSASGAYVLTRTGSSWSQQAKLAAVGWGLDVDGDTAVVARSGTISVFTRTGSSWTAQATVAPADGASLSAMALDGDTLVAGAPTATRTVGSATYDVGAGYVFVRDDGVWSQQARLDASTWSPSDAQTISLGASVAIDGDTVLLGAPKDVVGNVETGSAFIYVRSGGTWSERARLVADDGGYQDRLGNSVALDGSTALAGAAHDDDGGPDAGSTYVFLGPWVPDDPDDVQNDAGTGGDASDDRSNPTPLATGGQVHTFTGTLVPVSDPLDAYGQAIPAATTSELCFDIDPQPSLDIRLTLYTPGLVQVASSDAAGVGGTETVCHGSPGGPTLPGGQWVLVAELVGTPSVSSASLVPNAALGLFDYDGKRRCDPRC